MTEPQGNSKARARAARAKAIAAARPRARAWAGFGFAEFLEAAWDRLARALGEERDAGRFFLWLPVAAIAGILLFFAAPRDPEPYAAFGAFAGAGLIAYAARRRQAGFPVAMLVLAGATGFLSAAVQTELVRAPILDRALRAQVVGTIERVEPRARGSRIVIRVDDMGKLGAAVRPEHVRVTVRDLNGAHAGSRVSVEALWRPPPGPVWPGGYDFQREAFFMGLGAVGTAAAKPVVLPSAGLSLRVRIEAGIDRLRNVITSRITEVVGGDAGAIAAALVTGQRGEISREANEALRIAGLFHVISISGLHMALFGGTLFGVLRFGLVLIPGFGLRHPVKKYAALAALAGAAGYLALSGAEIATQRSFVMIAIVFAAIMFDRLGVTMRNLAVAALAAVILFPQAVLGPSFQMSFCAVMAIVAWYESAGRRAPDETKAARRGGIMRFAILYFGGIVATTIAATIATAPYATFHFQRFAVHSLPSNLIALPVVSLLVMPWALLGLVLMPFGFDGFAWQIMGLGIEIMLLISYWIAAWPLATLSMPSYSAPAAVLLAFGLVWACLWTTRLRWFGLMPAFLGVVLAAMPERPDMYVEPGGRAAAVRGPDGKLQIIGVRFARFAAESWLAADGDARSVRDASVQDRVMCDRFGCTAPLPDGRTLALSWTYAALAEDCARAAIVVTRLVAPPTCRETAFVLDGADLARHGAASLMLNEDGTVALRTARGGLRRVWQGDPAPVRGPDFRPPEVETGDVSAADGLDPAEADDEGDEGTDIPPQVGEDEAGL